MRFWPDGPGILVRWYFCEPNAKPLPFPTTFNSRNWTKGDKPWPEIGEIEGSPRTYDKGSPPAGGPSYQIVGDATNWREGFGLPAPPVPTNPDCEVVPPMPIPGGLEVGGDCLVYDTKWVTDCCPAGQPPIMKIWFRSLADPNPDITFEWISLYLIDLLPLMAAGWMARGHTYIVINSCITPPSFRLDYAIDAIPINSWGQSNVPNCSTGVQLYTGGVHLPPFDEDPFLNYLYDVWITFSDAPRPW